MNPQRRLAAQALAFIPLICLTRSRQLRSEGGWCGLQLMFATCDPALGAVLSPFGREWAAGAFSERVLALVERRGIPLRRLAPPPTAPLGPSVRGGRSPGAHLLDSSSPHAITVWPSLNRLHAGARSDLACWLPFAFAFELVLSRY